MNTTVMEATAATPVAITPDALLEHWQGHRRLTRRLLEAYPEDKLFTFSVGGMRPFSDLVIEMLGMAVPGLTGVVTGKWQDASDRSHIARTGLPTTKAELLQRWDAATAEINRLWAQIPAGRFQEHDTAFGRWEGPVYFFILYWIDNEIHHRAQAYVYMRALGLEPPAFWDRS